MSLVELKHVAIVPVAAKYFPYAQRVCDALQDEGLYVNVDTTDHTLNKKVREAQNAQYNLILLVGAEEEETGTVNIRTRDNVRHGTKTLAEFIAWAKDQ